MALASNDDNDDTHNIHNKNDNPAVDDNNSSDSNSDEEEDDEEMGEQVRISLTLAADCLDRSLEVPSEPLAVPATISRSGLSSVINHLLSLTDEEDIKNFDFVLVGGQSNHQHRLLRTGVEAQARRLGLSLEEAIPIIYFPARQYEQTGGQDELPDWVSAMSYCRINDSPSSVLGTGCYDGSLHFFLAGATKDSGLSKAAFTSAAHSGPVKCLSTYCEAEKNLVWMAYGSYTQAPQTRLDEKEPCLRCHV
jgi:ribosome biogenesis protein